MTTARDAILNKVGGTQTVLVYIATLDTGGIAYSGRTFVAVDYSEENAKAALFAAVKASGRWPTDYDGTDLTTLKAIEDYFGIRVVGPVPIGAGVSAD